MRSLAKNWNYDSYKIAYDFLLVLHRLKTIDRCRHYMIVNIFHEIDYNFFDELNKKKGR